MASPYGGYSRYAYFAITPTKIAAVLEEVNTIIAIIARELYEEDKHPVQPRFQNAAEQEPSQGEEMKRKNNIVKNQAIDPGDDVWSSDGVLPAKQDSALRPRDCATPEADDLAKSLSGLQSSLQEQPPAQLPPMRTYITSPQRISIQSISPETADGLYRYNAAPIDYGGQVKNDLVMNLADMMLHLMAETPADAARFFPGGRRIPKLLCDLKPLRMPDNVGQDAGTQSPEQELVSRLRATPFRLLMFSTYCDFGFSEISLDDLIKFMLRKAYWILRELGIDTANPYLVNVESLIPQQSRYRLGLYIQRPFTGLVFGGPVGDMWAWLENYCLETSNACYGQIWPLRSLVKDGCTFIKPCFLPHRQYSLWGLERLLYTDVLTVVLTPDLREYTCNCTYCGMAVVSWFGAQYTLPKVDFSPLAGRTVHYVFNPGSFNGDYQACLACMNEVTASLVALGCYVNVMANPQYSALYGHAPLQGFAPMNMPSGLH